MTEHGLSKAEVLYDRYRLEVETISERTDWFLIFHAILLEAWFTSSPRSLSVGTVGLLTSYLWLVVGVRQWWNVQHLGRCLERNSIIGQEIAPTLRMIRRARAKQSWLCRWPKASPAFCVIIPLAFVIVWLVLLEALPVAVRGVAHGWAGNHHGLLATIVIIGATIGVFLLRNQPSIGHRRTNSRTGRARKTRTHTPSSTSVV